MRILGLDVNDYNTSAALLVDGKIVAAAQEERDVTTSRIYMPGIRITKPLLRSLFQRGGLATLQAPLFQRGVGGISPDGAAPVVLRELRRGAPAGPSGCRPPEAALRNRSSLTRHVAIPILFLS